MNAGWQHRIPPSLRTGVAMSRQKIIANVSTFDRGSVVRVTSEKVLEAVRACEGDFTTQDIAGQLGIGEYQVRAALSWLVRRGIVERVGAEPRRLPVRKGRGQRETYPATLYRAKKEASQVDFKVLYRVFGLA